MLLSGLHTWRRLIRSRLSRRTAHSRRKVLHRQLSRPDVAAMVEQLEDRILLSAGDIEWIRQFGSVDPASQTDFASAVDADGNAYVAGGTDGALLGQTSAGGSDAFLRKYDGNGNEIWTRQFGTSSTDYILGVFADASGVYVAGRTDGVLTGQTSEGGSDAFLRKYDGNGNEIWTRQFGTSTSDQAFGVSADASGIYVSGWTRGTFPGQANVGSFDAFVRKYDLDGTEIWTRQFGSAGSDAPLGFAVDSSGVYVAGRTGTTLPGQTSAGDQDAFVLKLDTNGNEIWTRQFGSSDFDQAFAVSVDASGVYVAGQTLGTLPGQTSAGGSDAFIRKYDSSGTVLWTRQFGTSAWDDVSGISVDASGVYVTGLTIGTLPGQTSSGDFDAFVRKYDTDGNEVWTHQFGSTARDVVFGISVESGGVYLAGFTFGSLPGQTSAGITDAFVAKLNINTAPIADAGLDQSVNEGDLVTLNGSITDPDTSDTHTFLWQVSASNGQVIADGTTEDFSFTPADNGTYTVTYTATDGDGAVGTDTAVITVNNVAPTLSDVAITPEINENDVATLTGTITDPGTLDTFTLDVDWGDPLSPNNTETYTFAAGTTSFTLTHQYLDDNPTATASDSYTISVAVEDDDGGISSALSGAGLLYGLSTTTDSLYTIDPATGVASLVAAISPGNVSFTGLAFLGGTLFASDIFAEAGRIGTIDLTTGAYSGIGNQDGSFNWHGLAANESAGLLYSVDITDGNKLKSMTAAGTSSLPSAEVRPSTDVAWPTTTPMASSTPHSLAIFTP